MDSNNKLSRMVSCEPSPKRLSEYFLCSENLNDVDVICFNLESAVISLAQIQDDDADIKAIKVDNF